jgi:hypothetical protein
LGDNNGFPMLFLFPDKKGSVKSREECLHIKEIKELGSKRPYEEIGPFRKQDQQ